MNLSSRAVQSGYTGQTWQTHIIIVVPSNKYTRKCSMPADEVSSATIKRGYLYLYTVNPLSLITP